MTAGQLLSRVLLLKPGHYREDRLAAVYWARLISSQRPGPARDVHARYARIGDPVILEASGEELLELRLACERLLHDPGSGLRDDLLAAVAGRISLLGY